MDTKRQQLSVRVIRTTLAAALRGAEREKAPTIIGRAKSLVETARSSMTDPTALAELDRLERDLDNGSVESEGERSG